MLDARNCTEKAFNYAMNKADADVRTIPTNTLYILYTKYKADAVHLRKIDRNMASEAKERKKMYWNELVRRKTKA